MKSKVDDAWSSFISKFGNYEKGVTGVKSVVTTQQPISAPQQSQQFGVPQQSQQFGMPPQQSQQFGVPQQPQMGMFGVPQQPQMGMPPQQPQMGMPPQQSQPMGMFGAPQQNQGSNLPFGQAPKQNILGAIMGDQQAPPVAQSIVAPAGLFGVVAVQPQQNQQYGMVQPNIAASTFSYERESDQDVDEAENTVNEDELVGKLSGLDLETNAPEESNDSEDIDNIDSAL
jgi:hypothetical protein